MTIHLGPIAAFVVHFAGIEVDVNNPPAGNPVGALCRNVTGSATLHTSVSDWASVTCRDCIEWRHA